MITATYIDLLQSKRFQRFPVTVLTAGFFSSNENVESRFRYEIFELTLRLEGSEKMAYDTIDGIGYRTPFPHDVLKMPGQQHTYALSSD